MPQPTDYSKKELNTKYKFFLTLQFSDAQGSQRVDEREATRGEEEFSYFMWNGDSGVLEQYVITGHMEFGQ